MKKNLLLGLLLLLLIVNNKAATLYFGLPPLPTGNSVVVTFESAALLSAYISDNNLVTTNDWETHLNNPDINLLDVIVNSDKITFILSPDTYVFSIETGIYNVPGSSCNVIGIDINKYLTSLTIYNRTTWSTSNLEDLDISNLVGLKTLSTDDCTINNITLASSAPLELFGLSNGTALTNYTELYNYAAHLKLLAIQQLPTIIDLTPLVNLEQYIPSDNTNKEINLSGLSKLTQVFLTTSNNSIASLNIANTAIPVSFLNGIIMELDNNGISNGTLNITGLPTPTGSGLTAYNSLISKGWTIIN